VGLGHVIIPDFYVSTSQKVGQLMVCNGGMQKTDRAALELWEKEKKKKGGKGGGREMEGVGNGWDEGLFLFWHKRPRIAEKPNLGQRVKGTR
jgi:hypothetical protein